MLVVRALMLATEFDSVRSPTVSRNWFDTTWRWRSAMSDTKPISLDRILSRKMEVFDTLVKKKTEALDQIVNETKGLIDRLTKGKEEESSEPNREE